MLCMYIWCAVYLYNACISMYVSVCMWEYTHVGIQVSEEPEEGIRILDTGVTSTCETPDVGARKWIQLAPHIFLMNSPAPF